MNTRRRALGLLLAAAAALGLPPLPAFRMALAESALAAVMFLAFILARNSTPSFSAISRVGIS